MFKKQFYQFLLIACLVLAIKASQSSVKNQSQAQTEFLPRQLVTANLQCSFDSQVDGMYLGGCLEKCRKFGSLNEAAALCCNNPRCGGVTYSSFILGKGNTQRDFGFQLRSQSNYSTNPPNSGESSWAMLNKSSFEQQMMQGFISNNQRCYFGQRNDNTYLENCMFNCRPYSTLQEATAACCQNPECGGITWSSFVPGRGNVMENFGYQLRYGRKAMPKHDSEEISWVFNRSENIPIAPPPKKECPILYTECGFKGKAIEICDGNVQIPSNVYKSLYIPPRFKFTLITSVNGRSTSKDYTQSATCEDINILIQSSSHKVHKLHKEKNHLKAQN